MWGITRVQDRVTELDQCLLEHKGRIDNLAQVLDLSVLETCGIIIGGRRYGSCVAIGPDLILTVGHCIGIPDAWIEIGGVKYEILEKWASDKYDVGFVKIEGEISYVELGRMPKLLDEVYLVGSPYSVSFKNCITKGIISKLGVDWEKWIGLIQTDSEGAHGSSGCPLFNKSGDLLGVCVGGPVDGGGVVLCESVDNIRLALAEYLDR